MKKSTYLIAVILLLVLGTGWVANVPPTYQLAVVPQYTPLQIHNNWHGLIEYLNSRQDFRLELKVYDSFEAFESAVLAGEVDFVYLNPYQYVQARRAQGYLPLVRDSSSMLQGILVVRKDSRYKSVRDLNGELLAFPSPNALAASLYMRALLVQDQGLKFETNYVESHSNVYRHVFQGKAAAGGGVQRTFDSQPEGLRSQLRIIYTTPQLAPHPIAVHPRVSPLHRRQMQANLLVLSGSPLMQNIQMPSPIAADYRRDYQVLETLGLDKYWVKY